MVVAVSPRAAAAAWTVGRTTTRRAIDRSEMRFGTACETSSRVGRGRSEGSFRGSVAGDDVRPCIVTRGGCVRATTRCTNDVAATAADDATPRRRGSFCGDDVRDARARVDETLFLSFGRRTSWSTWNSSIWPSSEKTSSLFDAFTSRPRVRTVGGREDTF